jgi:vesicle-associated membrane protein 7
MSTRKLPGILYSVFARQDTRLCEYKRPGSDSIFPISQTTSEILSRLDHTVDTRRSFKTTGKAGVPDLHYHLQVYKGLTVLAVSGSEFSKRCAHQYLNEALTQFLQTTKDWTSAPAYHFQSIFGRQLEQIAEQYSNPMHDKVTYIKSQLNEATDDKIEEMNLLIKRGERIDILVDKTETLESQSVTFSDQARTLKLKFFWKNIRFIVIIVLVALVVLFLLVWFGCGVPDFKTCSDMINSVNGEKPPEVSGSSSPTGSS